MPKTKDLSLQFLFYALHGHDLRSLGADSAVPGLNRNLAYMSQQMIPPLAIVRQFDRYVVPIFAKMHENDIETRRLAALRDALLPKLLSGQIRIKDAEKFVGEAL